METTLITLLIIAALVIIAGFIIIGLLIYWLIYLLYIIGGAADAMWTGFANGKVGKTN